MYPPPHTHVHTHTPHTHTFTHAHICEYAISPSVILGGLNFVGSWSVVGKGLMGRVRIVEGLSVVPVGDHEGRVRTVEGLSVVPVGDHEGRVRMV